MIVSERLLGRWGRLTMLAGGLAALCNGYRRICDYFLMKICWNEPAAAELEHLRVVFLPDLLQLFCLITPERVKMSRCRVDSVCWDCGCDVRSTNWRDHPGNVALVMPRGSGSSSANSAQ